MSRAAKQLDVAIVGGGLAGNLLARQLRRQLPELSVGLFERSTERAYKVGEASVEITANYLTRRLGLTRYLYEEQLPKNGLRYFFDDETRSTPLERMSEIGTLNLPFHPAFQLDRARLETDLLEMNRRDGVHVRTGVSVRGLEFGKGGEAHGFSAEGEGGGPVRARWLVDAAGRGGLFARHHGLRTAEEGHQVGSAWGRFEGVQDIDERGDEAFRARVRHTSRRLSTNHFWYPGYWIWFIPLRGGLTSIGVTGECVRERAELRTPEGFRRFLDGHAAVAELLEGAKDVDFGCYTRIAYGTKRVFHADRWGLTGEAATSSDPLYSPGSDFIALENDLLCDLVARDLRGEGLAERVKLYDRFTRFRHQATMLLYEGLYPGMGSFELARAKWDFDIACYYNLWTQAYYRDEHLDADWLTQQLKLRPLILRALRNFNGLFQRADAALRARGDYFRANTGRFHYGLENIDFAEQVGEPRTPEEVMDQNLRIFRHVHAATAELVEPGSAPRDPLPLAGFLRPDAFA